MKDSDRAPAAVALVVLMAIGSVAMWVVNPVAWLWLASHLSDSSKVSLGPYLLVLFGIAGTMVVCGLALSRLNRAHARLTGRDRTRRAPLPWMRSLRAERAPTRDGGVLEVVMVTSVSLAMLAAAIWFFGFAGSSLPT